jgi:hypothetical protein
MRREATEEGMMRNFESLLTAYLVAWGVFLVYEFTVARRLDEVRQEIERLKQRLAGDK